MAFPLDEHPTFARYAWYPPQRDLGRLTTARQSLSLDPRFYDIAQRRAPLRTVQGRRAGHPDLVQFDLVDKADRPILVAPGELLAEQSALRDPRAVAAVERAGAEQVALDCRHLTTRLVQLRLPRPSPAALRQLRDDLRQVGVRASYTHIAPTLPPIKHAGDAPEPAPRRGPKRPAVPVVEASEAVHVVVLDTGVVPLQRKDFWLYGLSTQDNTDPLDVLPLGAPDGYLDLAAGHGTFVTGVVQQVAPAAVIRVCRVIDSDGVGSEVDIACTLIDAVEERLAAGAKRVVVNTSFGTETVSDDVPLALEVALEQVRRRIADAGAELRIVASAGNDGGEVRISPAAAPGDDVLAVAGLTQDLEPTSWSNRGDWVDFSTPAEGVLSTYVKGRVATPFGYLDHRFTGKRPWALWSGTSFSAPQVAGALAYLAQTNGTSLERAERDLREGAVDRRGEGLGYAVRVMPQLW